MKYEIYIDSLFLLNLGMNLYLLELTNIIFHHTATWKRVILGAVCGSVLAVVPLIFQINILAAGVAGLFLSVLGMSLITFRVAEIGAYLHLLEILAVMTFVLSAVLQYVLQKLPPDYRLPMEGLLFVGGVCFLLLRGVLQRSIRRPSECKVTLWNDKTKIRINAIVDTGNSLIEPISGAPVAVLDKKVFENLFCNDKPAGFRVIPYHSIDKKAGLMPGYLIPEMQIEQNGFYRQYKNIYVGVRQEETGECENYKMIINPDMLKEGKAG